MNFECILNFSKFFAGKKIFLTFPRTVTGKTKLIPNIDLEVQKCIEEGTMTPKKHPGRIQIGTVSLPEELIHNVRMVFYDYPIKNVLADGRALRNIMKSRHKPPSELLIAEKTNEAHQKVVAGMKADKFSLTPDEVEAYEKKISLRTKRLTQCSVFNWKSIEYTTYVGMQYIFYRMPAEFAALNKIFHEIKQRMPDYHPTSLFDFGSGVCTVTWAAKEFWAQSLKEFFYVDASPDMNELARTILTGNHSNKEISGVNFRQFLPASTTLKYNIVISSYTLFELPSFESRCEHLLKLWAKATDFLIIVEYGSRAGYELVAEARDIILKFEEEQGKSHEVHVFAPCPHELVCPRLSQETQYPCAFPVHYFSFPFGKRLPILKELYSFVVLKKGKRDENDKQWPRVVRNVLKMSKRAICRVCVKEGQLKEKIFSKGKLGTQLFHVGRSIKWGDRLPTQFTEHEIYDELDDEELEKLDKIDDEFEE